MNYLRDCNSEKMQVSRPTEKLAQEAHIRKKPEKLIALSACLRVTSFGCFCGVTSFIIPQRMLKVSVISVVVIAWPQMCGLQSSSGSYVLLSWVFPQMLVELVLWWSWEVGWDIPFLCLSLVFTCIGHIEWEIHSELFNGTWCQWWHVTLGRHLGNSYHRQVWSKTKRLLIT